MTQPLPEHVIPALSRSGIDRAAQRRTDTDWLDEVWRTGAARVLVVSDNSALVDDTDAGPALHLLAPADAPDGERLFLGERDGTAYIAVRAELPDLASARPATLREVGAFLSDADAGLLVHAVALDNWHTGHPRCPRCGELTVAESAGHVRRCPADGTQHFPRTDPAVIMLVHDGDDRCLLGRGITWPERRYSTLAGFVEPGESAEQAVVREVAEESGIVVTDIEYRASQPWPFPSSLMLGFRARAVTEEIDLADGELAEARWFTREQLAAAAAAGEVLRPPPVSIAYRLIADWLEGH